MIAQVALEEDKIRTFSDPEEAPDQFSDVSIPNAVIHGGSLPGWFSQAMRQIAAIQGLGKGWDSHGGDPPSAATIRPACDLLRAVGVAVPDAPKPQIAPTPSGGIQFAWQGPHRYLEIELTDPTTAQCYFEDATARIEETLVVRYGQTLNELVSLLCRVTSQA